MADHLSPPQDVSNETPRSKLRGIRRKRRLSTTQQTAGHRTLQGNETPRSKLRGIRRKRRLSTTQQAAGHRTLQGIELSMGTTNLPGRDVLDRATLRALNTRSNWPGALHLLGHLGLLLLTGTLIHATRHHALLLVPAMFLHGCVLVTLFAPMHESVHRTAFRSRWLNQVVGWFTGVLAFYNSVYYRRFHHWHHRFTQDPAHDPELATPKPRTLGAYVLRMSSLPFWRDKVRDMLVVSRGRLAHLPFVPAAARRTVVWSMRAQLALYLLAITATVWWQSPALLLYWLLPLLLGQPFLRALTFAEHTGCREESNGLTNTRTTLTTWPVRFLMWNMPYHAEHHLYPAIPFYALPRAHVALRQRIVNLDPGYVHVHQKFVHTLAHSAPIARV